MQNSILLHLDSKHCKYNSREFNMSKHNQKIQPEKYESVGYCDKENGRMK